ncbi:MAG: hypothetical protein ACOYEV_19410 [Candidatus Nanopelagicales bacterium]
MSSIRKSLAAVSALAGTLLTGCGDGFSQATAPTTIAANADNGRYARSFRADGVFAIGDRFVSVYGKQVNGQIPPGRYRVELLGGEVQGSWMRCRSLPCGPAYPNAIIAVSQLSTRQSSGLLELDADDVAVWLTNVSLTAVTSGV